MFKRFALMLALVAPLAHAAGMSTGLVTYPGSYGVIVYFMSSTAVVGKPACNTANRWTFDSSTDAGKATMTLLMTAKATGSPVYIIGTGFCSIWIDSEDLDHIYIAH